MLAVGKLRLTQNIYIILNLVDSKEVNKKNGFPHRSVKKAAKAESVEEIICMQFPLRYVTMRRIQLQGTQTLLWSFWTDRLWEHFRLCEEEFVRHKVCMFSSTYFRFQIKNMISLSKLASYRLLTYHNYYEKHPCKTRMLCCPNF